MTRWRSTLMPQRRLRRRWGCFGQAVVEVPALEDWVPGDADPADCDQVAAGAEEVAVA
jgi:hypothetical protein